MHTARQTYLYIGCYTNDSPIGIHVYDWRDPDGALVERSEDLLSDLVVGPGSA